MVCRQVHSTTTFPHYLPHFFNAPTLASPAYPQHQLPFRPPEHPPSRTTTQFGFQRPAARMDYLQPEEELAHLQKLSNEYQPEVTVSVPVLLLRSGVLMSGEGSPCWGATT